MVYLIQQGLEEGTAFTIMESVRKGKGLKPEWEEEMSAHGVPDWYIWSCKKIKYMFPKAHAVAYVMMAFRIAWFKVHRPLAFYAAYFSIRAKAFDERYMCRGMDECQRKMREIIAKTRRPPPWSRTCSPPWRCAMSSICVDSPSEGWTCTCRTPSTSGWTRNTRR